MSDFLMVIYDSPHWVFIALGGLLLIAELLGTGGYALWSGIAAIVVGLIACILPLSWPVLWILFSIFTLTSAYIWCVVLKKRDHNQSRKNQINQPQQELIGIKTVVTDAIINGSGRVKIKDGTWSARCDKDLDVGQSVEVISINGLTLHVKPLNHE